MVLLTHPSDSNMKMFYQQIKNFSFLKCILHVCLLASSCAFIVRNVCEESGAFSVVKQDYILNGTVITTIYNQSYHSCKYACISNHLCKSFNVENKEVGECQLNQNTTEDENGSAWLMKRIGWTFASTSYKDANIGKYCQKHKPCQNGEICKSTCECPGYNCLLSCNTTNDGVCPKVTGLRNCALNKNATLSTPNPLFAGNKTRGRASNAVNGIYEKKFQDCASVDKSDSSPTITIDLGADIPIYEITITGSCMENFDINVAKSIDMSTTEVCKASVTLPGDGMRTFTCDNIIEGRYVFVKAISSLVLCEVEVFGRC